MKPITELPLIDGRPMTPEEEVRFWRFFYAESQRLFGDKKGTLEAMTAKAMKLLEWDAMTFALSTKDFYEYAKDEGERQEWRRQLDERKQGAWKRRYVPHYLETSWYVHTRGYPRLSKEVAVRKIAEDYRFPSVEAAYKELQRIGIKGLPSTWPK